MSTDDDFFAIRRFDRLHCRVLLTLQDHLVKLEDELDLLDGRLSEPAAKDVNNGSVRSDQPERVELLEKTAKKLSAYGLYRPSSSKHDEFSSEKHRSLLTGLQDELLNQFLNLKARPLAPGSNRNNIKIWLSNNNGPIHPSEADFINTNDLITALKSPKSRLRCFFEQCILAPTNGLFGLLAEKSDNYAGSNLKNSTVYGRDEPVDALAAVSLFTIAVIMLIVPLWVLAAVSGTFRRLAVITAFLVAFLGVLTWGTTSRPFEILAATAG